MFISFKTVEELFLFLMGFSTWWKKEQWLAIVKKINLVTGIPPLNLIINVKEDIRQAMCEALSNKHIIAIEKDIIENPDNSLRIDT